MKVVVKVIMVVVMVVQKFFYKTQIIRRIFVKQEKIAKKYFGKNVYINSNERIVKKIIIVAAISYHL